MNNTASKEQREKILRAIHEMEAEGVALDRVTVRKRARVDGNVVGGVLSEYVEAKRESEHEELPEAQESAFKVLRRAIIDDATKDLASQIKTLEDMINDLTQELDKVKKSMGTASNSREYWKRRAVKAEDIIKGMKEARKAAED
uniref:Uncharacterized protein n=1 Tax=Pygoscelis antarcticus TaxID=79643 RepID=A0A7G7LKG8_PYGAN|nr:hypothetical protein [Pygoscelis antarcticus]